MFALLLAASTLTIACADLEFQLENGLTIILQPRQDRAVAVVALGVRTGVDDEPEGRNGLAHLAEHLFWQGGTASYPEIEAFERLSREGPIGARYQDVNGETLWNLTYFYATRPAGAAELALEIFAEKLNGVTFSPELLAAEREKVLSEIEFTTANLEKLPALKRRLEAQHRRPKAGTAADVRAITRGEVESYLTRHYRPDRAIVLVSGAFDVETVRARSMALFSDLQGRESPPQVDQPEAAETPPISARYTIEGATARERAALTLAAAAWQAALRKHGIAYVEVAPGGWIRAVLTGGDIELLHQTRDTNHEPLPRDQFNRARASAGNEARSIKMASAFRIGDLLARTPDAAARQMIQASIDRLRLAAEGGRETLDLLDGLSPEVVAEVSRKYLNAKSETLRAPGR